MIGHISASQRYKYTKQENQPITTVIRSGRLIWYGHVMSKNKTWVNKYMEIRKTWLENVDVDMAELENDREDIHDPFQGC